VVPGIDFSNDPLLAGRIHSYVDTQISRLGGPNFHEIPVNSPVAPVHNNQRDGMHRQAIHRGRVSYEPNSLAGGCPFQAGAAQGFMSVASRQDANDLEPKVRAKPEKFADHYTQARLFFDSQTPAEQAHVVAAFRFELSKVTVPAIRQRMVSSLRNVSDELAQAVAGALGMEALPPPMPLAIDQVAPPEVTRSEALSMLARPGDGSIAGRKVAILVAPGSDGDAARQVQQALLERGAVGRFVASRIGPVALADGSSLDADASTENSPGFLFDGLVVTGGEAGVAALQADDHVGDFIRDQYRHCKPILAVGAAASLLKDNLPTSKAADAALIRSESGELADVDAFLMALSAPRDFARESRTRA
jgi:catalase